MKVKKLPYAGMSGIRGAFVKHVHEMVRDGDRNHREVFNDFLDLAFCAYARTTHLGPRGDELEERYMKLVRARDLEYIRKMPALLGMLVEALHTEPCDFLGSVAGELGALSEGLGQFFTPFEVSQMMTELLLGDEIAETIKARGHFTVGEPACGSGGMLLAIAHVLQSKGFDPSHHMYAHAVDLSGTAFQMAYIQLSARGIPADVVHGNSLTLETFGAERTPAAIAFHFRTARNRARRAEGAAVELPALPTMSQLQLSFER